jgi:hypothetical protein
MAVNLSESSELLWTDIFRHDRNERVISIVADGQSRSQGRRDHVDVVYSCKLSLSLSLVEFIRNLIFLEASGRQVLSASFMWPARSAIIVLSMTNNIFG